MTRLKEGIKNNEIWRNKGTEVQNRLQDKYKNWVSSLRYKYYSQQQSSTSLRNIISDKLIPNIKQSLKTNNTGRSHRYLKITNSRSWSRLIKINMDLLDHHWSEHNRRFGYLIAWFFVWIDQDKQFSTIHKKVIWKDWLISVYDEHNKWFSDLINCTKR